MKTVTVTASRKYDVIIGTGLHCQIGSYAAALTHPGKAAIISDSNVWPLYANVISESLTDAGFSVCSYVFPAGEASKNGNTFLNILNFLAENRLSRTDTVIALGGGVVGDITGFAAATYLRGISYIQVPTTLLSMVDSSVGGKTAIDLPAGKNLAGAFYQPSLVLCDTDTLATLPTNVFRDGCAEVIKYGVLFDPDLLNHLIEYTLEFDKEKVVSRCVELKRDVVSEDEFDRGARQLLNLGHTIGHSIEALSNLKTTHGQAVAMGMSIVSTAGCAMGICNEGTRNTIIQTIRQFGLPTGTDCTARDLYQKALSDKKVQSETVNLIIPQVVGHCIIRPTPLSELQSFIEAGLR